MAATRRPPCTFAFVAAALAVGFVGRLAGAHTNAAQTLTPAQQRALKHLPPPIVVPRSLPSGFHVTELTPHDFAKKQDADGWGYDLRATAPGGGKIFISEATSGFGDPGPDRNAFHLPFTVTSPVLGAATFQPVRLDGRWCYYAYVAVPKAIAPPIGDKPAILLNTCELDRAQVAAMFASFTMLKPQTPYPNLHP